MTTYGYRQQVIPKLVSWFKVNETRSKIRQAAQHKPNCSDWVEVF